MLPGKPVTAGPTWLLKFSLASWLHLPSALKKTRPATAMSTFLLQNTPIFTTRMNIAAIMQQFVSFQHCAPKPWKTRQIPRAETWMTTTTPCRFRVEYEMAECSRNTSVRRICDRVGASCMQVRWQPFTTLHCTPLTSELSRIYKTTLTGTCGAFSLAHGIHRSDSSVILTHSRKLLTAVFRLPFGTVLPNTYSLGSLYTNSAS